MKLKSGDKYVYIANCNKYVGGNECIKKGDICTIKIRKESRNVLTCFKKDIHGHSGGGEFLDFPNGCWYINKDYLLKGFKKCA